MLAYGDKPTSVSTKALATFKLGLGHVFHYNFTAANEQHCTALHCELTLLSVQLKTTMQSATVNTHKIRTSYFSCFLQLLRVQCTQVIYKVNAQRVLTLSYKLIK